uniref:Uncharacterized protein n=1 Tax=Arundo donax TaxID=35708 RepID=A0A0A9EBD5_ARUDO
MKKQYILLGKPSKGEKSKYSKMDNVTCCSILFFLHYQMNELNYK